MSHHYSDPAQEREPFAVPDIEVFYQARGQSVVVSHNPPPGEGWLSPCPAGWYWWRCMPGGGPDRGPRGPFKSWAAALDDARDAEAWIDWPAMNPRGRCLPDYCSCQSGACILAY